MKVDHPDFPRRIRRQDPEAIQMVVCLYLPQIFRAARGAGLDPHQAEDVVQETFATFIQTASRFEGRSHVRTWLFGILYKKIAEARRGVHRDQRMDDIDEVLERRFSARGSWMRPPQPLDAQIHDSEIREGIQACLEEAPTQQRTAFVLREVEGLATPEICNILAVTRTNLGVLLYRVRNRLRECLEAKGLKG